MGAQGWDSMSDDRGEALRSLWGDAKLQHEPRCVSASHRNFEPKAGYHVDICISCSTWGN